MKPTQYDFTGKVAFVTGASTGIGRASALAFAKGGAKVAVVDVNVDEATKTAHLIEQAGGIATFIKCDVSKSQEVKAAIEKTVSLFGSLDIAFNNAGIEGQSAATANSTEENWDKVINTNLKGCFLCMREELNQMLKQKGGAIINCASIAGVVGFAGSPAYVASKHGIVGLTKVAALEYAKANIRVNAICPGVIQTPMIDRATNGDPKMAAAFASMEPVGRFGQPEEIASAALWLASHESSFVTGHSLVVDGGWVAQ